MATTRNLGCIGAPDRPALKILVTQQFYPTKSPTFGSQYGGPVQTRRGRLLWMFREGQRVRFFDTTARQVGPEFSNVAPALIHALAKGWAV